MYAYLSIEGAFQLAENAVVNYISRAQHITRQEILNGLIDRIQNLLKYDFISFGCEPLYYSTAITKFRYLGGFVFP